MVFGGGRRREAEASVRREVAFWKAELDHAVEEKKALLSRYTELYHRSYALEDAFAGLSAENCELRHVLVATETRVGGSSAAAAAAPGGTPPSGRSSPRTALSTSPTSDARGGGELARARVALKQADVRIAILEDRNAALSQEVTLLGRQGELLRASEAAYQREAELLRDELSAARGINDLTADEATKLLLEHSRLQQALSAAQRDVLHKDEMLRLLSAEVSELNARLEASCSAAAGGGVTPTAGCEGSWAESGTAADVQGQQVSQEGGSSSLSTTAAAVLSSTTTAAQQQQQPVAEAAEPTPRRSGPTSSGGGAEAAVEALAAAMPLRLSTAMLRASAGERRGAFSGQPITPRDIAALRQQLEAAGEQQQAGGCRPLRSSSAARGTAGLGGRPPTAPPSARRRTSAGGSESGAAGTSSEDGSSTAAPAVAAAAASSAVTTTAQAVQVATAAAPGVASATEPVRAQALPESTVEASRSAPRTLPAPLSVAAAAEDDDAEGMTLQGSPNLDSPRRGAALLRPAPPALTLAGAADGVLGAAAVQAQPAAAAIEVKELGLKDKEREEADEEGAKGVKDKETKEETDEEGAKGVKGKETKEETKDDAPSKPVAAAPAAAGKAMSGGQGGMAAGVPPPPAAVNEFKLAALVTPPPPAASVAGEQCGAEGDAGGSCVGAPLPELAELEPGIPQRQQALARLVAEQQGAAARAAAARAAAAPPPAAPGGAAASPRSTLAEAMADPAAIVAVAAAAGVLDEPPAASVRQDVADSCGGRPEQRPPPAAGCGEAPGSCTPVAQRAAALARLALEQEARILCGASGGGRPVLQPQQGQVEAPGGAAPTTPGPDGTPGAADGGNVGGAASDDVTELPSADTPNKAAGKADTPNKAAATADTQGPTEGTAAGAAHADAPVQKGGATATAAQARGGSCDAPAAPSVTPGTLKARIAAMNAVNGNGGNGGGGVPAGSQASRIPCLGACGGATAVAEGCGQQPVSAGKAAPRPRSAGSPPRDDAQLRDGGAKPGPAPRRQLSGRMAAMRAAFEGR